MPAFSGDYKINGSTASMGPVRVSWTFSPIGTKQSGQVVYSSRYQVIMEFSAACPAEAAQWIDAVSGGSLASLTIPNKWATQFTDLSSVHVNITEWPALVDVHTEPFTLVVFGVL